MKTTEKFDKVTETVKSNSETLFDIFKESQEKSRESFVPLDDAEERLNKVLSFCVKFLKYQRAELRTEHIPESLVVYVAVIVPMLNLTKDVLDEMRDVAEYLNNFSISQCEGMIYMELHVKYYKREKESRSN